DAEVEALVVVRRRDDARFVRGDCARDGDAARRGAAVLRSVRSGRAAASHRETRDDEPHRNFRHARWTRPRAASCIAFSDTPAAMVSAMASRGKILIVDDEANARAALSEILHDEGYQTETAADGFKALRKLEEFAPDVILTDVKMPGLDGIAFMDKARAAAPSAVFIVMTAFGTISSAVAAVKKGADN